MLHIHRAERADGLVDALGELIAEPLSDPFAAEVVSVPTRGMERWLAQRLSMRLGVCANVDFPSPHRVVSDAIAAACGVEPDEDPWRPERSAWALLEVVDAHLEEAWLHRLRKYLGEPTDDVRRSRRLGIVRHLAELFDRYALHRPDMVRGWAEGTDDHWQAELWRRLRARIGREGPAERLARFRGTVSLELPYRLSLFGLTRLPAGHLHVLEELATQRDVHLFLLHPSPTLWERIGRPPQVTLRSDDPTALTPRNALLASWGRDAREMQLVLARTEHHDHHHPVEHPAGTQLAQLQAAVRADEPPPTTNPDGSLVVHSCHGRARQVEVLRDAILHTLEADPTLEPRDVIVMCPDIETFAPLIQAAFGANVEDGGIDLRVRLADRSLRQTNPVLGVVAALLDLAGQRVTASQVLDLADREPVRRRFRLDDDALARLQGWIADSGIRWGLDQRHRKRYRLENIDTGTWRFGIDRLLAGVTMTEDERRLIHGVLPLDDVDSQSIDLAGRFAELVERLDRTMEAFSDPQPLADWIEALGDAADAFAATAPRDAWQRAELQRILDDLAEGTATDDLHLAEIRAMLADRLQGRPTRANFRTGHLTICTLVPMRSVPHRVVCLLGLDDGVFPRKAPRDGDDLMLDDPRVGERDPRAEDRQLLLDALLAAQDKLIVTYTGNDERTNAGRPPAVPLSELLSVAGRDVVIRHPLQPFDPRNFENAWSHDAVMLEGARALQAPRHDPPDFLDAPLTPLIEPVLELDELVRFVEHPVRRFLRRRLGIDVRDFSQEVDNELEIELDALGRWGIGQRLLDTRLQGTDAKAARKAEIARGRLPPGYLGRPWVEGAEPTVDEIVAAAGTQDTTSVDVRVTLAGERSLRGTVAGVTDQTLRTVTFSRLSARHRAGAWVRLLALNAAGHAYGARTIGKGGVVDIAPLGVEEARAQLASIVELYELGMTEPLPLICKTSAAYVAGGADAARKEWTSEFDWPKEDADPEHVRAFGGVLSFEQLAEDLRFAGLARKLWDPIRERERWG
ncbi:MAG: exodeoxyribonuclease V subunit gamma [Solirubrobacteraceae bacterium]